MSLDVAADTTPAAASCSAPLPRVVGVETEHLIVHARGLRFHIALAGPADAEPLVLLHVWRPQHRIRFRSAFRAHT